MDGKILLAVVLIAVAMVGFIVFLTNNPTWEAKRPELEALHTAADDNTSNGSLGKQSSVPPARVASNGLPSSNTTGSAATPAQGEDRAKSNEKNAPPPNSTASPQPAAASVQPAKPSPPPLDFASLAAQVQPSIVRIDAQPNSGSHAVTGYVVDSAGLIATNYRAIDGAKTVSVTFQNGKTAKMIALLVSDPKLDVAILKISADSLAALSFAEKLPGPGQAILAFGATKDPSAAASDGVIVGVHRGTGLSKYEKNLPGDWIQTTAQIAAENSGGPLINAAGQVVGMSTTRLTTNEDENFAVSAIDVAVLVKAALRNQSSILAQQASKSAAARQPETLQATHNARTPNVAQVSAQSPPIAETEKANAAPQSPDVFRTWTATNGYKIEAEYVSAGDSGIVLKRRDGKSVTVAASLLSRQDLDYIAGLAAGSDDKSSTDAAPASSEAESAAATPPTQKPTVANVEQLANNARTAKEALAIYQTLLADDSIPNESKTNAKARLANWQDLAGKGYVRLGARWVPPAEAAAAHAQAIQIVDSALDLLTAGHDPEARQKLEKASAADPNTARADYLLGLLYGLGDRNYKKAQTYFVRCVARHSSDVSMLNNLAVMNVLANEHATAIKNFDAALAINPASPEVVHNLRRVLDLTAKKMLTVGPGSAATYSALYARAAHSDSSGQDRTGWLFVVPAADYLDQSSEHEEFCNKVQQLPHGGAIAVTPQLVEDRACTLCRGSGEMPCQDCHGRGTVSVTGDRVNGTNPITNRPDYLRSTVREDCPTCGGSGKIRCPNCTAGVDPTLR